MFSNKSIVSVVLLISALTQSTVLLAERITPLQAEAQPKSQAEPGATAENSGGQMKPVVHNHYPNWPQRRQVSSHPTIIPPPPPGPYMSTALNNNAVNGKSLHRSYHVRPEMQRANQQVPDRQPRSANSMDMFSPDRPWPKSLRASDSEQPKKLMPPKGYRFVSPRDAGGKYAGAQNRPYPQANTANQPYYRSPQAYRTPVYSGNGH